MGENLSTDALEEDRVRVGDIWRLGSARLQVCQPRSPCWKIDERFGCDGMAAFIDAQRLTGWYWRVLTPGEVAPGDGLLLEQAARQNPTLAETMALCAQHRPNLADLARLAAMEGIAARWREKIEQRLNWLRREAPDVLYNTLKNTAERFSMNTRLKTVADSLAAKLDASNSEQQRKACVLACELALQAAGLNIPIASEALNQLRQNGKLSQEEIEKLRNLAAQLDEKYFNIQDQDESGAALKAEALRLFSQARAVSSLSFAGGEDALIAAKESIYEASMSFEDSAIFFAALANSI
jgi:hypothetical protein